MKSNKKKYNLPPGFSLLQTAFVTNEFLRHPIAFMSKALEKFSGTYASTVNTTTKVIVTQDPEFINYILRENNKNYQKSPFSDQGSKLFGKGLFYSNGDHWLKQRRLIQPGFHKEKINSLYGIVIKSINDFIAGFPVGERIDIYPLVHKLSFDIAVKSLFNTDLSPKIMDEIKENFIYLQDFLLKDINQPWRRLFYPFTGTKKTVARKSGRLREIVIDIIRQRKVSNENYVDLLDMLLTSKHEDNGETMSEEQVADEVLILILAGHETTGNTLAWLLYLLASNGEKMKKLLLSFENTTIYDSLHNEYLKATINEGMRLYPAAWMTDRVAIEDDQFGEFSFPKNTILITFFFGMNRNKKLWNDELKFEPERFIVDSKLSKPKYFFPFGAGPRMCIGNNFALAEMCFFLQAFLQNFQITGTGQIPEMKPLMTLRPDKIILQIAKITR